MTEREKIMTTDVAIIVIGLLTTLLGASSFIKHIAEVCK